MSTVIHTGQGVRVWGWVHAVSPAWATLKYKLEIAASAVCGNPDELFQDPAGFCA